MIDSEAIKARCRTATPGPWGADCNQIGPLWDDHPLAETTFFGDLYDGEANAIFIACARTDVPELLAEVERLRRVMDERDVKIKQLRRKLEIDLEKE